MNRLSFRSYALRAQSNNDNDKDWIHDDSTSSSNSSNGHKENSAVDPQDYQPGDKVQVEVTSFGPMGASVDVVAFNSHDPDDVVPSTQPALCTGLILQKEIHFYRLGRGGVDVLRGEILPGYVERILVDEETQQVKINIGLREFGGKAKAESVSGKIMERLKQSPHGVLPVGDKSPPSTIQREFPGVSKVSFKKAVSALYKQHKVKPGPDSISLM